MESILVSALKVSEIQKALNSQQNTLIHNCAFAAANPFMVKEFAFSKDYRTWQGSQSASTIRIAVGKFTSVQLKDKWVRVHAFNIYPIAVEYDSITGQLKLPESMPWCKIESNTIAIFDHEIVDDLYGQFEIGSNALGFTPITSNPYSPRHSVFTNHPVVSAIPNNEIAHNISLELGKLKDTLRHNLHNAAQVIGSGVHLSFGAQHHGKSLKELAAM